MSYGKPSETGNAIAPRPGPGTLAEASRPESPPYADGVPLKEIFGVLRRQVKVVLAVTIITLMPVAAYVYNQQPTYQASALIRLADARRAITGELEDETREKPIGRLTDEILSQIQVLQSRTVLEEAVDRSGLRLVSGTPGFQTDRLSRIQIDRGALIDSLHLRFTDKAVVFRGRGGEVQARYGMAVESNGVRFVLPSAPPGVDSATLVVMPRDATVDLITAGLFAIPRTATDAVDVTYTSTDPYEAQRVVNAVVQAFRHYDATMGQLQSQRRRRFLEGQLRNTESLLIAAQHELSSFRSQAQVFNSESSVQVQQQALLDLDLRREELMANRRMYSSLLATITGSDGDKRQNALRTLMASPEISSNPVVKQLSTQLVQYEGDRDELIAGPQGSTVENPDVRRLNSLISATEAKLADATRSYVASLGAQLTSLDELRARRAAEAERLPRAEAEEDRLMQQVASIGRISEQLRTELQNARMAEAVEGGQVEILNLAPAAAPTPSRRGLKLVLALALGLVLGGGSAFVVEAMNTSIRRPQEVSSLLRVPRLATIPRIEVSSRRGLRLLSRATFRGSKDPHGRNASQLTSVTRSHAEEAYRTLRTNLIFAARSHAMDMLVVTSASPKEGKSTTVANLAMSFALQGFRVLLIDADLRRPMLHRIFSVPQEPGFSSLLGDRALPTEAIHATAFEGLYLMPSGDRPHNLTELLGGLPMRRTLAELRGRFDLLILDTPPVLAAAETAVLAAEADAVLMVIRAGQTDRGAAEEAMRQLTFAGARVVGAVLNDPDAQLPRYGSYYHAYAESDSPIPG